MRTHILVLSMMGLAACAAPAARSPQRTIPIDAVFVTPMDPGAISCEQLNNLTALATAREWGMGHARAALLAGKIGALPTDQQMSSGLAQICTENPSSTVRDATRQMGL